MMSYWRDKRVLLTGGTGFLGSYVTSALRQAGCNSVFVVGQADYDLVRYDQVERAMGDSSPHVVIHLATKVGGIGINREKPGEFFYDNLMMGAQLMEVARQRGAKKIITPETTRGSS
jgi:GDP-L-fucose synthase